MDEITSRLLLISFIPFKDTFGIVHSGEAKFYVESLGVTISVFFPYDEDARKLMGEKNSHVEVIIDPPYFEVGNLARDENPSIMPEPPAEGIKSQRYRIIGRLRKGEKGCGVFECGALRFKLCPGQEWIFNSKEKEFWMELRNVRFYGYLPRKR